MNDIFNRVELLAGREGLERLRQARVIIFGLGGVGSWAAESLARTAIGHITLVDADDVATTNINRQLPALLSTVGQPKVDIIARRIADINPQCEVVARRERYTAETADSFDIRSFDYCIDAIDSVADKAALIVEATSQTRPRLFSSMGAALRCDPTRVTTAEFRRVEGDALAAALRRRFRKTDIWPRRKFRCVYSTEQPRRNASVEAAADGAMAYGKVAVNGALCHVTAIFGLTLAGLVVNDIIG